MLHGDLIINLTGPTIHLSIPFFQGEQWEPVFTRTRPEGGARPAAGFQTAPELAACHWEVLGFSFKFF